MKREDEDKPIVLTVAGSDPSGGAGIQADLKTFWEHGCYGTSVITATTAQNTTGISEIHAVPSENIQAQLEAVLSDLKVGAVKTGMLSSMGVVRLVADTLKGRKIPLLVDPVLSSSSGTKLGDNRSVAYLKELFPLAWCVTPNIPEAVELTGRKIDSVGDMKKACTKLIAAGCRAVLLTGGHLEHDEIADVFYDGNEFVLHRHPKVETNNLHGTGCVLSAAIAANLAKGFPIKTAVRHAVQFLQNAIENSRYTKMGKGNGPVLQ